MRSFLYIVENFPSLTEHFIFQEIHELTRRGHTIYVIAKRGNAGACPEFLKGKIVYYTLRGLIKGNVNAFISAPVKYAKLFFNGAIFQKELSSNILKRIKNFLLSTGYYWEVKDLPVNHIHAHFSLMPATQAYLLSQWMVLPFSFTTHAHDLYVGDVVALSFKMKAAKKVITCTQYNKNYLGNISADLEYKIHCVYHGINVHEWRFRLRERVEQPLHILFVGRLVEKKGCSNLIEAVKLMLTHGINVECTIIGDGPLRHDLESLTLSLELKKHVTFHGSIQRKFLQKYYDAADVFVLPCRIARNGDRDGLPNVILEAMASGLPVISTEVSAIPELLQNEMTGLLISPENSAHIFEAVKKLVSNSALYAHLSRTGFRVVSEHFDFSNKVDQLEVIFCE